MAEAKSSNARWWLAVAVPAFIMLVVVLAGLGQMSVNRERDELRKQIGGLKPGYAVLVNDKPATNPRAFVDAVLRFREYSHFMRAPGAGAYETVEITDGEHRIALRLVENRSVRDENYVYALTGEQVAILSTAELQAAGIQ
jgi:hypothetical protein